MFYLRDLESNDFSGIFFRIGRKFLSSRNVVGVTNNGALRQRDKISKTINNLYQRELFYVLFANVIYWYDNTKIFAINFYALNCFPDTIPFSQKSFLKNRLFLRTERVNDRISTRSKLRVKNLFTCN